MTIHSARMMASPLISRAGAATGGRVGPKITFAAPIFDFGRVAAGKIIQHDFVFTNAGDESLEIKDVRPSCGCTTTRAWDRRVEPGKSGTIPLQLNTSGFAGPVSKTAIVLSDDPSATNVILQITGTVWNPIDVTPAFAGFRVTLDSPTNETRTVRIVNNMEEPLELSQPECTNRMFQSVLETIRPGKEFALQITFASPLNATNVVAPITLKTSSTNTPILTVPASAMVQPAMTITPTQITLPEGPLLGGGELDVTIRNNGVKPLALSEPTVNVPNVRVRVQELQPGRVFILWVGFPAGYQIPAGQSVEAHVKTDHPKFPVIGIPVVQAASLAALQDDSTKPQPRPANARTNSFVGDVEK